MLTIQSAEIGICFLCYHGLVRERGDARLERNFHLLSDFREQMRWVKRQPVLSLREAAHSRAFSRQAAVITFDDGYANNLLAAEILSDLGLPWTVFVSTGAIGTGGMIWTVELSLLLLHGECARLEALQKAWPLGNREEREPAFQTIRYRMKAMPARERRETMNEIRAQFPGGESRRLLDKFPAFQMLTWNDLARLAEAGVEVGSHGVEHEIHQAAQDARMRRVELVESKHEIERRLGKPCRAFAFPNGDTCEDSAREVEDAGYEMAFTTRQDFARPDANRFLLPRVSPSGGAAKLKKQMRDLLQR
ncbi:MAG TPA: polysaccharide deacetylase family protein [Verrucomicrobiae bacterium]|jgi:peptidoglycan/xylan/chitin deacetylase (PgdA/CDA1 family)